MIYVFSFVLILFLLLLVNTLRYRKRSSIKLDPLSFELSDEIVDKLKEAVKIKSVSHSDYAQNDLKEFAKFLPFIEKKFPRIQKELIIESFNPYSILIHWPGTNPDLKPVLLLAHYDVVPVEEDKWTSAPFAAEERDGYIWGRGTLDTKNTMISALEAVEQLLSMDFQPERSIYLAFGGDEETMGLEGAGAIVRHFKKEGIQFEWLLDEGGVVAENSISLLKEPLALVGISEKGYVNVKVSSTGKAGHSSMPPDHSAAGLICKAMATVEANPFPTKMTTTMTAFLKAITPYVSFPIALVLSNRWLFSPLIRLLFKGGNQTAALVRTTQAVTVLRSGDKENVLPSSGEAIINVRILPGETVDSSIGRIENLLKGQDVTVTNLNPAESNDPVEESSTQNSSFQLLQSVIGGVYPRAVTAPYMMTGGTDSKHYKDICESLYRFSPMSLKSDEISLIHSHDERISRENFEKSIKFYMTLINQL